MSQNRDGQQKGAQDHADGQHGSKAHTKFLEDIHGKHGGSEESEGQPQEKMPESGVPREGRHRLFEEREQHDEADKNSEKNRLAIERERGKEVPDEFIDGTRQG